MQTYAIVPLLPFLSNIHDIWAATQSLVYSPCYTNLKFTATLVIFDVFQCRLRKGGKKGKKNLNSPKTFVRILLTAVLSGEYLTLELGMISGTQHTNTSLGSLCKEKPRDRPSLEDRRSLERLPPLGNGTCQYAWYLCAICQRGRQKKKRVEKELSRKAPNGFYRDAVRLSVHYGAAKSAFVIIVSAWAPMTGKGTFGLHVCGLLFPTYVLIILLLRMLPRPMMVIGKHYHNRVVRLTTSYHVQRDRTVFSPTVRSRCKEPRRKKQCTLQRRTSVAPYYIPHYNSRDSPLAAGHVSQN